MDYFYSKAKGRFYTSADRGVPRDAVRIDPVRGAQFLNAQVKGDAAVARGEPRDGFIVQPAAIEAAIAALLPNPEFETEARRARRNQLLATSDHWFVSDRNLPEEVLAPWRAYRQQLRDLDLEQDVEWPAEPGSEGA